MSEWLAAVDWTREGVAFVAATACLLASWKLGSRHRGAWLVSWAGNAGWTVYAVLMGSPVIVVESLLFQALAIRGWVMWGKNDGSAARPESP